MRADLILLFQDADRSARVTALQLAGDRQADDARPDDRDVTASRRLAGWPVDIT
jgi:hypothetical protein